MCMPQLKGGISIFECLHTLVIDMLAQAGQVLVALWQLYKVCGMMHILQHVLLTRLSSC